jgi:hypothetical protein
MSISTTLAAISRLKDDALIVARALQGHVLDAHRVADHELHAYLHRLGEIVRALLASIATLPPASAAK